MSTNEGLRLFNVYNFQEVIEILVCFDNNILFCYNIEDFIFSVCQRF